MINNSERSQQFAQRFRGPEASSDLVAKGHIERVSRRHRSMENGRRQSTNTVHVNVRNPHGNHTNNNQSLDPIKNLLAVRYYLTISDVCFILSFVFAVFIHSQYSISANADASIIASTEFTKKLTRYDSFQPSISIWGNVQQKSYVLIRLRT